MELRSRQSEFQVVIALYTDDGRLFPLTENSPLCLVKICNVKLIRLQLNALEKFGATDILIVAQEDYKLSITDALSDFTSDIMKVELIIMEDIQGSADCLRHVAHRIRNDFIFLTSDVILQFNIGDMINFHRVNAADVTIGLAGCRVDEPEKKGGQRKVYIDEDDREYIGMYGNGRVVLKLPVAEAETSLDLKRAFLNKAHSLIVRSDLLDSGIYILSKWIIDLLLQQTNILHVRSELLPFLIKHQYQPSEYLQTKIPLFTKVSTRSRCGIDKWIAMQENQTKIFENRLMSIWQHTLHLAHTSSNNTLPPRRSMELCDYILTEMSETMPSSTLHSQSSNLDLAVSNKSHNSDPFPSDLPETEGTLEKNSHISDDIIRCFGYICPYSANGVEGLLQRVTTVSSFLSLNRDLPLQMGPFSTRVPGYQKKELSTVGPEVFFGDKSTVKQCTIGSKCVIGARSKLNGCVLMDGVSIGDGCTIQNSIICSNVVIEGTCSINDCQISEGVTVLANSKVKGEVLTL